MVQVNYLNLGTASESVTYFEIFCQPGYDATAGYPT
jgi:hypothetical protein